MSTISFVVRDSAGNFERGLVGSQGLSALPVSAGQAISLNLRPSQVVSYARNGQALEVTLNDGQVIVLQDFFTAGGDAQADLYLSTDGVLSEVALVDGGNGMMMPEYAIADSAGKWSPNEGLYFGDSVSLATADPAVMTPEVGMIGHGFMDGLGPIDGLQAAALGSVVLGGAALAMGGGSSSDDSTPASGDGNSGDGNNDANDGGSGSGGSNGGGSGGGDDQPAAGGDTVSPTPPAPVVAITSGTRGTGTLVNQQDHQDGVTIGGTGTAGATITVTTGSSTETTTVAADGSWSVTFDETALPGGEYSSDVTVQVSNANGSASVSDVFDLDTQTSVTFAEDQVGGADNVVNHAEAGSVVLTGTVEPGSTEVIVTVRGTDYSATITGGTWSLDLSASVVNPGEYELPVAVRSTDAHGNTASTSGTVEIDTLVNQLSSISIEGEPGGANNLVNSQEALDGVQLVGAVEAGSTVVVTYEGQNYQATVTGTEWTVTLPESALQQGTAQVVISATDAHGNTASITDSFLVDTTDPEAPRIGNVEDSGVAVEGFFTEALIDGDATVTRIDSDGTQTRIEHRVQQFGDRNYVALENSVPDGSDLIVTAHEEGTGNTSSTYVAMQDAQSSVVVVDPAALSQFSITDIDLDVADAASLTLNAADIAALSATSDTLRIHGDSQDSVTLQGVTATNTTQEENGTVFNVYTLEDGHTVLVDQDITNVTVI